MPTPTTARLQFELRSFGLSQKNRGNRSRAGDWLIFRAGSGRKMCLSPSRPRGQSHFRGLRRENWDSPRERLRIGNTPDTGEAKRQLGQRRFAPAVASGRFLGGKGKIGLRNAFGRADTFHTDVPGERDKRCPISGLRSWYDDGSAYHDLFFCARRDVSDRLLPDSSAQSVLSVFPPRPRDHRSRLFVVRVSSATPRPRDHRSRLFGSAAVTPSDSVCCGSFSGMAANPSFRATHPD